MLIQFTVKNFKSIRDAMTLDMQATDINEDIERVINFDNNQEKILPLAVIYGPNGGGKSNVLEALNVLVTKVASVILFTKYGMDFRARSKKIDIKPFAFSEETKNEPTEFIVFFKTELAEYRYELHIKGSIISFEMLSCIQSNKQRLEELFCRTENEITLKGRLAGINVSDELSKTIPLLSYLGFSYDKNEVIKDTTSWFTNKIVFRNYGNPRQEMMIAVASSDTEKKTILNMIKKLDLDIEDFRLERDDSDHINRVYTKHIVDGVSVELDMDEESRGTRKIFGLLPFIVQSISQGKVLVIDELDAKLHPLLLKYIIGLFSNMDINKRNAQLIFTSHDLSTMNNTVFRKDEVWFVAKGNKQNSKLYSLVDFKNNKRKKERKNESFDQQYLQGKYGADPYLQKILNWSEVDE